MGNRYNENGLGIKVEADAQLLERKDKDPQEPGEESATTCKRGWMLPVWRSPVTSSGFWARQGLAKPLGGVRAEPWHLTCMPQS